MAAGNAQLGFAIRAINESSKVLREIQGDLGNIESAAEGSGRRLGLLGGAMNAVTAPAAAVGRALGDVAKIAGGFVVGQGILQLPGMFTASTNAARDLEQSIGGVESVFRDSADTILEWGKTAYEQAGLSKNAFYELAAPLGAMLKSAGFEDFADQTINLTQRAADLAATFGGPVEDAVSAIGALLRGETDPIERYGVAIKQADVNMRALADTGKSSVNDLTPLELQQARLALLFEQTADSTGQFAREADTAAGKAERLKARQENLAAELGQHLLPLQIQLTQAKLWFTQVLATHVIPAVGRVASFLADKLGPALSSAIDLFRSISGAAAAFAWDALREFGDWVSDTLGPPLSEAAGFVRDIATAAAEFVWDALQGFGDWIVDTAVPALQSAAEAVSQWAQAVAAFTWEQIQAFGDWLSGTTAFQNAADQLGRMADALVGIDTGDAREAWGSLTDALADGWGSVRDAVQPALAAIRPFAEQLLPAIRDAVAPLGDDFRDLVEALAPFLDSLRNLQPYLETLGRIIGAVIVVAIIALIVQLEIAIKLIGIGLHAAIVALTTVLNLLHPAFDLVTQAMGAMATFIGAHLVPAIQAIALKVLGFIDTIGELLAAILGKATDFFSAGVALLKAVWDGMTSIVGTFLGWIRSTVDSVRAYFNIDGFAIGKAIIEGIGNGMMSMKDWILGKVGDIAGSIGSKLNPANWKLNPTGIHNWYAFYLQRGLENMYAAARQSRLPEAAADAIAGPVARALQAVATAPGEVAQMARESLSSLGEQPIAAIAAAGAGASRARRGGGMLDYGVEPEPMLAAGLPMAGAVAGASGQQYIVGQGGAMVRVELHVNALDAQSFDQFLASGAADQIADAVARRSGWT